MYLKIAAIGFALAAFATGLRSAQLWYRASRIQIIPMWLEDGRMEPVDPYSQHVEWLIALIQTVTESSELNRKASLWTASIVVLATLSTLASAI